MSDETLTKGYGLDRRNSVRDSLDEMSRVIYLAADCVASPDTLESSEARSGLFNILCYCSAELERISDELAKHGKSAAVAAE